MKLKEYDCKLLLNGRPRLYTCAVNNPLHAVATSNTKQNRNANKNQKSFSQSCFAVSVCLFVFLFVCVCVYYCYFFLFCLLLCFSLVNFCTKRIRNNRTRKMAERREGGIFNPGNFHRNRTTLESGRNNKME